MADGLEVVLILELDDRTETPRVALVGEPSRRSLPSIRTQADEKQVGEAVRRLLGGLLAPEIGARLELKVPARLTVNGFPTRIEPLYLVSPHPGVLPVAVEVMGEDCLDWLCATATAVPLKEAAGHVVDPRHRQFLEDYPSRKRYKNPTPTVDIVVPFAGEAGEERIVLVDRAHAPLGWALPGGFAEYQMTYEDTANKEVAEETGLEVALRCLSGTYSDPDRDPERMDRNACTVVFVAEVVLGQAPTPGSDAKGVGLFTAGALDDYVSGRETAIRGDYIDLDGKLTVGGARLRWGGAGNDLCFDHARILRDYFGGGRRVY